MVALRKGSACAAAVLLALVAGCHGAAHSLTPDAAVPSVDAAVPSVDAAVPLCADRDTYCCPRACTGTEGPAWSDVANGAICQEYGGYCENDWTLSCAALGLHCFKNDQVIQFGCGSPYGSGETACYDDLSGTLVFVTAHGGTQPFEHCECGPPGKRAPGLGSCTYSSICEPVDAGPHD